MRSRERRWRLHGLVVASHHDLGLGAADEDQDDRRAEDLRVDLLPPAPVERTRPAGHLLAERRRGEQVVYWATRSSDRSVTARLPGFAELTFRPDVRSVALRLDPEVAADLVPVLVAGPLLATALQLKGHHLLHASAVVPPGGGGAIAFVGPSGSGKSTLATIVAAGGGALLTDDVLRLDQQGSRVLAHRGASAARLRDKAAVLLDQHGLQGALTGDRRLAVALPAADAVVPVSILVLHHPQRDAERVHTQALRGSAALLALLRCPRLPGWVEPAAAARTLAQTSDLLVRVPVVTARVPWGPPFPEDLAGQLVDALAPHREQPNT